MGLKVGYETGQPGTAYPFYQRREEGINRPNINAV